MAKFSTSLIFCLPQNFSMWDLTSGRFLGTMLSKKGYTTFLNFIFCWISNNTFDSELKWWLIGFKVALRMLPPSEPMMNTFLFIFDWFIASPLTGIIAPYFFLNIKKPLIGYFNKAFTLAGGASSVIDCAGTYHNNILPSVPRERIL